MTDLRAGVRKRKEEEGRDGGSENGRGKKRTEEREREQKRCERKVAFMTITRDRKTRKTKLSCNVSSNLLTSCRLRAFAHSPRQLPVCIQSPLCCNNSVQYKVPYFILVLVSNRCCKSRIKQSNGIPGNLKHPGVGSPGEWPFPARSTRAAAAAAALRTLVV